MSGWGGHRGWNSGPQPPYPLPIPGAWRDSTLSGEPDSESDEYVSASDEYISADDESIPPPPQRDSSSSSDEYVSPEEYNPSPQSPRGDSSPSSGEYSEYESSSGESISIVLPRRGPTLAPAFTEERPPPRRADPPRMSSLTPAWLREGVEAERRESRRASRRADPSPGPSGRRSVRFAPGTRSPSPARPRDAHRETGRAPAYRTVEERALAEARSIRHYFEQDTTHFRYMGMVGYGGTSVVVQVKHRRRWWDNRPSRMFVVKRPFRPGQEEAIINEDRILRRLRGAEHIVQPYRVVHARNPLKDAPGRSILMEYVQHGSLGDFIARRREWGHELPNRVLSRLFMCLVRFCIAMAYPPRYPRGAVAMEERIPRHRAEREDKYQLVHSDLHPWNILFGDIMSHRWEHDLTPIMKLIDFERAGVMVDRRGENLGVKTNIFNVGLTMRSIITGHIDMYPPASPVTIRVRGADQVINSHASFSNRQYPNLDEDIETLVIQCCAVDPNQRPTLERLSERVRREVETKNADYYRDFHRGRYESDHRVKDLIQRLILDAPVG
ncbi:kinase-like domain-containing protein [Hypoxylon sp. NC1633]|nr:kinase-like domain-containing protein [Hypoxylon sp. NC1633]